MDSVSLIKTSTIKPLAPTARKTTFGKSLKSDQVVISSKNNNILENKYFSMAALVSATIGGIACFKLSKVNKILNEGFQKLSTESPKSLKEMADSVVRFATVDKLSGIYNRASFDTAMTRAIQTAQTTKKPLSTAIIDMDYFKSINDILGHKTGDDFIQRIGANIAEITKKHGVEGFRYGGEEFAILLAGKNKKEALEIIQETAQKINSDPNIQNHLQKFIQKAKLQKANININQAKLDEVFNKMHKGKHEDLDKNIINLLKIIQENVSTEENKIINNFIRKIKSNSEKLNLSMKVDGSNQNLGNLLNTHLNKERELGAIESWLKHVTKQVDGKDQGFTVSAGISEYSGKLNAEEFFKQADDALYQCKEGGRARVEIA